VSDFCDSHKDMAKEVTEVRTILQQQVVPGISELRTAIQGRPDKAETGLQMRVQDARRRQDELEAAYTCGQQGTNERVDEVLRILRGAPSENGNGGLVGRVSRLESLLGRWKALAAGLMIGAGVAGYTLPELVRMMFP